MAGRTVVSLRFDDDDRRTTDLVRREIKKARTTHGLKTWRRQDTWGLHPINMVWTYSITYARARVCVYINLQKWPKNTHVGLEFYETWKQSCAGILLRTKTRCCWNDPISFAVLYSTSVSATACNKLKPVKGILMKDSGLCHCNLRAQNLSEC
jgi:hypothetical protein